MKILFFSPHSAVWEHAYPEALVASALKEKGHEVIYITCGETFKSYCMSMAAKSLRFGEASAEKRASICKLCNANKALIRDRFGFSGYDMSEVLTEIDRAEARKDCSSLTKENFLSFEKNGIPIGRTSVYEVILHNKKRSFEFNDYEWTYYLSAVENSLLSLQAARKILDREKPEAIAIYSPQYSVNHVWKHLAEQLGIRIYHLQGGASIPEMRSRLVLASALSDSLSYGWVASRNWEQYKNAPATEESVKCVVRHFERLLLGGAFTFSAARKPINVREYFTIPTKASLLTATLSSFDELVASESVGHPDLPAEVMFRTQPEWVEKLIEFVRKREDLFLLIRPHPREFPRTGGNPLLAENVRTLEEKLQNLPPNVRVNWPDDQLSMYDIAEETDVLLNGFSSVGAEFALFGIPVVTYLKIKDGVPSDLNRVGTDQKDYFKKIDQAISDGWQPNLIRKAFRWFSTLFYWESLDLSESYGISNAASESPLRRLFLDPQWFLDSLKDRVLKKIGFRRIPTSTQKHFLRAARIPKKLSFEIDQIFSNNLGSLLDVRKDEALNGSTDKEEVWLRKGVGSIVAAMARSGRSDSPLVKRLKAFSAGETL